MRSAPPPHREKVPVVICLHDQVEKQGCSLVKRMPMPEYLTASGDEYPVDGPKNALDFLRRHVLEDGHRSGAGRFNKLYVGRGDVRVSLGGWVPTLLKGRRTRKREERRNFHRQKKWL
jgi:hypothetical protein